AEPVEVHHAGEFGAVAGSTGRQYQRVLEFLVEKRARDWLAHSGSSGRCRTPGGVTRLPGSARRSGTNESRAARSWAEYAARESSRARRPGGSPPRTATTYGLSRYIESSRARATESPGASSSPARTAFAA